MAFSNRPDGTRLKDLDPFRNLLPHLMRTRTESAIYFEQQIDVTETLSYLETINDGLEKKDRKLTFFQIVLTALARTVGQRPQLNRFISGHHYYQRNKILFNFVAKKTMDDGGEEINVKIPFSPDDTLHTVPERVKAHIDKGKSAEGNANSDETAKLGRLPRPLLKLIMKSFRVLDYHNLAPASMIRADPFYSTCFISNLGSVGIEAPFHHNFEWGNCSLFVCIGKIRKERFLDDRGRMIERDMCKFTFSLDDRISEGIYCARAIDLLKSYIEDPVQLEQPPEITEKQRRELNLCRNNKESVYV